MERTAANKRTPPPERANERTACPNERRSWGQPMCGVLAVGAAEARGRPRRAGVGRWTAYTARKRGASGSAVRGGCFVRTGTPPVHLVPPPVLLRDLWLDKHDTQHTECSLSPTPSHPPESKPQNPQPTLRIAGPFPSLKNSNTQPSSSARTTTTTSFNQQSIIPPTRQHSTSARSTFSDDHSSARSKKCRFRAARESSSDQRPISPLFMAGDVYGWGCVWLGISAGMFLAC